MIELTDLSETEAVDRLIDRFAGMRSTEGESVTGTMRYPGEGRERIDTLLTRNAYFTGRDAVLRQLREELRSRGTAIVLQTPTIQGIGGVGKTQVALEYAHRFKEDYDVVWWLNCEPPQYVDASLVDLGKQLREVFKASVPEEGGADAVTRQVLQYLSERAAERWLLIYDNAEDIAAIQRLLPSGGGHILITSRNERWEARSAQGKVLRLGYFERPESISHLRRRLPAIAAADAEEAGGGARRHAPRRGRGGRAARQREDARLRVPGAGSAAEPVRQLPEGHPLLAYPEAVAKAWHLSLDELERRSAAAARLLRIWAVMVPEISFDLILQRRHGGHSARARQQHLGTRDDHQAGQADRPARADQGGVQRASGRRAPGRPDRRARAHVGGASSTAAR